MSQDRILQRYRALARRTAEALEAAPTDAAASGPESTFAPADTPDEVFELLEDAVYRLGLYVSAMPGARPRTRAEFEALATEVAAATECTVDAQATDSKATAGDTA